MIVSVNAEANPPKDVNTLNFSVAIAGIKDDGSRFAFTADVDVTRSASSAQITSAIKNAVIAKSVDFGASNIAATDIFVSGAN